MFYSEVLTLKNMLRLPAVAGQFYPENKRELATMVGRLLSQAKPPEINGEIFGLLLPHAGYLFSGLAAAHGFKIISGKKFDTVILIGDSHYERFDGVSVWPKGSWQTPFGEVKIDEHLAAKIMSASKRFIVRDSAHLFEHSLETQLPFLQKVLKNFKIVPIIFGSEDKDWPTLARAILKNIKGRNVLIVASSDLSHYLPYREARRIDRQTIKKILILDSKNLAVCGKDAVKALLEIARAFGAKASLLKYANSADMAGAKKKTVGYGALAFYSETSIIQRD